MGRKAVIRAGSASGGPACTGCGCRMCNAGNSCGKRRQQCRRKCGYGASDPGIPCIRRIVHTAAVIRTENQTGKRPSCYYRSQLRVRSHNDGDRCPGKGCKYDFRRHDYRRCCSDPCRTVYPSDPESIPAACYRYGYSGNRSFSLQHSRKLYGRKLFQYK